MDGTKGAALGVQLCGDGRFSHTESDITDGLLGAYSTWCVDTSACTAASALSDIERAVCFQMHLSNDRLF